jgi:N-acetylneuraminic acid mutarotase
MTKLHHIQNTLRSIALASPLLILTACGGGTGGTTPANAPAYKIGGTLIGLISPNTITLAMNGGDNLTLTTSGLIGANGRFTFTTPVANNTPYSLSIATLPAGQACTFTYGSGSVTGADVTNLSVICGPASVGSFVAANNMATAQQAALVTLLGNGDMLMAGGFMGSTSAQLYNPSTDIWSATDNLPTPRSSSDTATLLPNGKVLVVGGGTMSGAIGITGAVGSAHFYDPSAAAGSKWTAAPNTLTVHGNHTATLLPNGKVLVAGGFGITGSDIAEIYDPVLNSWTAAANMHIVRTSHTATVLPNGKVLLVGETANALTTPQSSEVYDPSSNTWSTPKATKIIRHGARATMLPNGKVLLAGGYDMTGPVAGYELYDPANDTWTLQAGARVTALSSTFTLLPTGKVLAAGGIGGPPSMDGSSNAELYDPVTNSWAATGSMNTGRYSHAATLLPNGKVLIMGGTSTGGSSPLASTEFYW